MTKLHLLWDLDGTLVDSEQEILSTIEKALAQVGISMNDATSKFRIGPPVREVIKNAFPANYLSEERLEVIIKTFREIYDTSDFKNTKPFEGIESLINDTSYVHHIITNKPFYATNRILGTKGWKPCIADVITPDSLMKEMGKMMSKPEMFKYCRAKHPNIPMVGIGDMAIDAMSANDADIMSIGALWGTGTRDELETAGCNYIVETTDQLKDLLISLSR